MLAQRRIDAVAANRSDCTLGRQTLSRRIDKMEKYYVVSPWNRIRTALAKHNTLAANPLPRRFEQNLVQIGSRTPCGKRLMPTPSRRLLTGDGRQWMP